MSPISQVQWFSCCAWMQNILLNQSRHINGLPSTLKPRKTRCRHTLTPYTNLMETPFTSLTRQFLFYNDSLGNHTTIFQCFLRTSHTPFTNCRSQTPERWWTRTQRVMDLEATHMWGMRFHTHTLFNSLNFCKRTLPPRVTLASYSRHLYTTILWQQHPQFQHQTQEDSCTNWEFNTTRSQEIWMNMTRHTILSARGGCNTRDKAINWYGSY